MIKKRTKKRRNPSMLEEIKERRLKSYDNLKYNIRNLLRDGNPIDFVKSMILYKRGRYCNDCDKEYHTCRCDDCEECGFVECLCPLNIKYKGEYPENYTDSEKEIIKEEAYKFLIYILNDDLYNDGRKYNLIPGYSKFKKLREEFLKNAINKSEIDLSKVNLQGEDLSGANLSGADLSETNLSRADLTGANLSEALLNLANLSGANLSGANLSGANLSRADLAEANLSKANLHKANLSKADLMVANLTGANLSEADLSKALLNIANLSTANLTGTNLTEADLHKTDFTNAIIKNTIFNDNPNIENAINLIIPNPAKTLRKSYKNNKNFSFK